MLKNSNQGNWQSQNQLKNPTGDAKGCVAVSWDKQTWNNGYWKGIIRYEWLFSQGTETLVVHGYLNSEDTGISNQNWKATYINTSDKRKERQLWNESIASNPDLENKMPKSPKFASFIREKHWGFNPDYSKKCSGNHCQGNPWKTSFESKWKWHSHKDGKHDFSDWSENFSNVFIGTDKHLDESFKNAVTKEKGSWESF